MHVIHRPSRLAVALLACIAGGIPAATASAAERPQRVLCIGDSITAADGSWAAIVGEHPEIDTINAGKGGRQTGAAADTFQAAVDAGEDFDRVIFFLGVNNLPGRDPRPADRKLAGCVADMGRAIDLALRTLDPQDVILVAPCSVNPTIMRQPSETDPRMSQRRERNLKKGYDICQPILAELEAEYRKLAATKRVRFVSVLEAVSPGNFPDGLHPNADGQRQIAAVIAPALLEATRPRKAVPAGR
jgi:lysophospholipase L1-like esterase